MPGGERKRIEIHDGLPRGGVDDLSPSAKGNAPHSFQTGWCPTELLDPFGMLRDPSRMLLDPSGMLREKLETGLLTIPPDNDVQALALFEGFSRGQGELQAPADGANVRVYLLDDIEATEGVGDVARHGARHSDAAGIAPSDLGG
jgi:hypothetical protein